MENARNGLGREAWFTKILKFSKLLVTCEWTWIERYVSW